jgi:hypothetical protein
MQQPVETGRQENPHSPERFERVLSVGTYLRGRHYGQRSCVPHQQVEHTAAPTSQRRFKKSLANGGPSTHGELPATKQGTTFGRNRIQPATLLSVHEFSAY